MGFFNPLSQKIQSKIYFIWRCHTAPDPLSSLIVAQNFSRGRKVNFFVWKPKFRGFLDLRNLLWGS